MLRTRVWLSLVATASILSLDAVSVPAGAATVHATSPAVVTCAQPSRVGKFSGIQRARSTRVLTRVITPASCGRALGAKVSPRTPPAIPYTGSPPLALQPGGSVMGTSGAVTVTPIYWAPTPYAFPASYKSLTSQFVTDAAHDSGTKTNVFATLTQYYDSSNAHIAYNMVAGTPITDTAAYPSSGGCTADSGQTYSDGSGYTACLTDPQLETQLTSVLSAKGLSSDLNHLYLLFLPKGVETCFTTLNNSLGGSCSISSGNQTSMFCGYHSYAGSATFYATLPYSVIDNPVTGGTCSSDGGVIQGGQSLPNETPNGNLDADTVISVMSHEMSEAITDPYGNAWVDGSQNEIGDDCAYIYGDTTSFKGSSGAQFNQVINGDTYFIQEEFSNQEYAASKGFACIQQSLAQTVSFTSTPPTFRPIGAGYTVTATATSFLATSLAIDAASAGACTINGSTSGSFVSFKKAGTCIIDATQPGSSQYTPASRVQQSFSVGSAVTDGAGTMVVGPTSVTAGTAGNTLTFTYTAAAGGTSSGGIDIVVPAGWTAPTTSSAAAGAVTSTCGSVAAVGSTIELTGVTLAGSATCTTTYGSKAASGPGATATSSPGLDTFSTTEKSTAAGTLTAIATSPQVGVVTVGDGTGTMAVAPTPVTAGAPSTTETLTYTAGGAGTASGAIDVVVPAGWTAPSASPAAAGAVTSTCGTVGVVGSTIELTGVTLAGSATCTTTYGSRAASGPGAVVGTTVGANAFDVSEESSAAGTLSPIAVSPSVTVVKALTTTTLALSSTTLTFGAEGVEKISVAVASHGTTIAATGAVTVAIGSSTVCTLTLVAGTASCTLSAEQLAPEFTTAVGTYAGASGLTGSASSSHAVGVARAATTTALTLSTTKVKLGKEGAERLSVSVVPRYAGSLPSGEVTIKTGTKTVCTITLVAGKGTCTLTARKLAAGTRMLVALYPGSALFFASSSLKVKLTVTR